MRPRHSVLVVVLCLLVLGGLLYAGAQVRATRESEGFICPLTGERLPCPKCCPMLRQPDAMHNNGVQPSVGAPS